jgi:3D (Asp-Asp-Asp) domain-containing protein
MLGWFQPTYQRGPQTAPASTLAGAPRTLRTVRGDAGSASAHHRKRRKAGSLGPLREVSSTCYSQGTITASGEHVYVGEVANNEYPLGTKIRLEHPVFGLTVFSIEDRIGSGSQLDVYNPSEAACIAYGRQEIGFRVIERIPWKSPRS